MGRTNPLKPLDDALAELLAHAQPLPDHERVDTLMADGRVLAQEVISALHVPPQDNSAMDGYAVRCADVQSTGTVLPISQRLTAGSAGSALASGTTARIFTGAPVPAGADAIVLQEDCTSLPEGTVQCHTIPVPGQWIRRAGEDIARGTVVLAAGTRMTPAALGLAASVGLADLLVVRRPRVALFSSGDELVMPGEIAPDAMPVGAIYNSNRFFLRALLQRLGCEVTDLGTVADQREATLALLQEASAHHDLILSSGGVSVGEEDHVKPAVEALGRLDLWQIAIKPGKPFAYGRVGAAHFIGLPGNPVSSLITFAVLVRPFLLRLQGVHAVAPHASLARADFACPHPDQRREFLRVRRNASGGLDLFPNQSSGVLTSMLWGDGLVDKAAGQPIAFGDTVRFLPFSELLV